MTNKNVCDIIMQIFVTECSGEMPLHPVNAIPSDTIYELKRIIQNKVGIPKDKLKLYFDGEEFNDAKNLEDYPRIRDGAVIHYIKKGDGKITIFVKQILVFSKYETVAVVRAKPNFTILELKRKIEKIRGFPWNHQNLFYCGLLLTGNDIALHAYEIKDYSSILLRVDNEPMPINLRSNGKNYVFCVTPDTTIKTLKIEIRKFLFVDVVDQNLLFHGNYLKNDSTFAQNDINEGSTITLHYKSFILPIVFSQKGNRNDDKTRRFECRVNQSTQAKRQICKKLKIESGSPLNYRLNFKGKQLNPDKTVSQIGIGPGDCVELIEERPTTPTRNQPKSRRAYVTKSPRPVLAIPPKGIGPIAKPNVNDVLCGRGGRIHSHAGNVQFRHAIHSRKKEYLAPTTKKLEKAHIAAGIVNDIRTMNPPGRFLKEEIGLGIWYDIGDVKAIMKTGQALREDAPNIRPAIDENGGSPGDDKKPSSIKTSENTGIVMTAVRGHKYPWLR